MKASNAVLRFLGSVMLLAFILSCVSPSLLQPSIDVQPTLDIIQTQLAESVNANLTLNAPQPTLPAPTEDIQATLVAVQTQSAGTVLADLTLNAPTATPTLTAPTEDIQATLVAVQTQSAGTVIADLTLNAPAATPTAGQTPTRKPTARPACGVSKIAPKTNTVFYPKDDFDAAWVITNNTNTTWYKDEMDFYYSSGDKLQKWFDMMDLEKDIESGESYTLAIDMTAPADPGTYATTWVAYYGEKLLCTMNVSITVKARE